MEAAALLKVCAVDSIYGSRRPTTSMVARDVIGPARFCGVDCENLLHFKSMSFFSWQTEKEIFKHILATKGIREACSVAWFNFRFQLGYKIGGFRSARAGTRRAR